MSISTSTSSNLGFENPGFPNSRTRTIAIIGDPIGHSLTPRIQNAAWAEFRQNQSQNQSKNEPSADCVSVAYRVSPQNLEAAVRGAQALGFLGLMVTIPHKEKVLSLCDELDPSAQLIGAANLLHFRDDGRIVGHSSDGWAALKSLGEQAVEVAQKRICLLGGGGAARSLALTLAREGAREITLLNRTVERAQAIAEEVLSLGTPATAKTLDESTLGRLLPDCDLLINATSIGMTPHEDASPVPAHLLDARMAVYDIVYNPLETRLLREAANAGAKAVDGLGMLIYTNVYAAQICTGHELSAAVMRREALEALL